MNNQIDALFCIDKIAIGIIGIFQKIYQQIFIKLFRLFAVTLLQQARQISLKNLNCFSIRLNFQVHPI
ncbi:MAG: hypothetical protein ACKPJT_01715 [Microcystis panniformis]